MFVADDTAVQAELVADDTADQAELVADFTDDQAPETAFTIGERKDEIVSLTF